MYVLVYTTAIQAVKSVGPELDKDLFRHHDDRERLPETLVSHCKKMLWGPCFERAPKWKVM